MNFLIDNQLPLQLAFHLRSRGHNAVHVLELQLMEASDVELWIRCQSESRVLVSKDEDFIFLANRPGEVGRFTWIRLGNCRNAALLAAIDRVHDDLIKAFESGQRIVEVR